MTDEQLKKKTKDEANKTLSRKDKIRWTVLKIRQQAFTVSYTEILKKCQQKDGGINKQQNYEIRRIY